MQYSFSQTIEKAKQEYNIGSSDRFKFQEGYNRIRVVSPSLAYQSSYKGNTNVKFVTWILDRKDGECKLAFLPTTIISAIASLQLSDDYAFNEVPMPYDINVHVKNAGTKEVEYQVLPTKEVSLTPDELAKIEQLKPIEQIVERIVAKQDRSDDAPIPTE